jgi:predicted GIY-YIG superfamily endonuclease
MGHPSQLAHVLLERLTPLGVRWSAAARIASPYLREDATPWVMYPVNLAGRSFGPSLPPGPAIYAIIGDGAWQYVGRTTTGVQRRLAGHASDKSVEGERKRRCWAYVVVLALDEKVPAIEMARLESVGKSLLNPRMGSRWG